MGDGGKRLHGAILIFHPIPSHFLHSIPFPPYSALPPAIGRYWPNIVTPLARSGLVNRFPPLPRIFFPPNISPPFSLPFSFSLSSNIYMVACIYIRLSIYIGTD